MAIPERIVWAIDHLAVRPGDRLLEIGCGRGVAVAGITPLLIDGHITGLDRSDSAISAAEERNRAAIAAGKAALVQGAFADWKRAGSAFDKVFAINVNLFWLEAMRELAVLKPLLAPGGRLFLFFEPPTAGQVETIRRAVEVRLKAAGYVVEEVMTGPAPSPPLVGIVARPAG
ncbi:SAM-dependent methyltransferase [Aminobacter sp. HY435]|uniref:SAM-dependent methyltransferase n=1 Tax=Aminobacter sp. HY435 TaxID=2970917 RepID=UPI0022B97B61|nr:class I SAM-dependent methyltransferase [Aminobacter sp. HY435]